MTLKQSLPTAPETGSDPLVRYHMNESSVGKMAKILAGIEKKDTRVPRGQSKPECQYVSYAFDDVRLVFSYTAEKTSVDLSFDLQDSTLGCGRETITMVKDNYAGKNSLFCFKTASAAIFQQDGVVNRPVQGCLQRAEENMDKLVKAVSKGKAEKQVVCPVYPAIA